MADTGKPAPRRRRGETIVAIVGIIATAVGAIATSQIASQSAQDSFWAQRSTQLTDQQRGIYADYLASTSALCNTLVNHDQDSDALNSAFANILTQKARIDLIAPDDVRSAAQDIIDYLLTVALAQAKDGHLEGCETKAYTAKSDAFIKVAKSELPS